MLLPLDAACDHDSFRISSSARVRLSPAVGQREVELNSSRPRRFGMGCCSCQTVPLPGRSRRQKGRTRTGLMENLAESRNHCIPDISASRSLGLSRDSNLGQDTSRRATPKCANGAATRNALTVEREGLIPKGCLKCLKTSISYTIRRLMQMLAPGVRARHGHQKKRASTATDVDVAFEEAMLSSERSESCCLLPAKLCANKASRTNLGKNQGSHVPST